MIESSVKNIIFHGEKLVKANRMDDDIYRGGRSTEIDVDQLIHYSQLISCTTTAPATDVELMHELFQPPAPQEFQIQSGILFQSSGAEPEPEQKEDNIQSFSPIAEPEHHVSSPQRYIFIFCCYL